MFAWRTGGHLCEFVVNKRWRRKTYLFVCFEQADRVQFVFGTFPYYALPIAEQKYFVLILQRVQYPRVLMSGTFPLNMELFVTVNT